MDMTACGSAACRAGAGATARSPGRVVTVPDPVAGGPTRTHERLGQLGESGTGGRGENICHGGYVLIGNKT